MNRNQINIIKLGNYRIEMEQIEKMAIFNIPY